MQAQLPQVARWLLGRFPRAPEGYESGRIALRRALARHLDCSDRGADEVLDDMERAGYLRYAAEARAVGGSAGKWICYPEPEINPVEDPPGERPEPGARREPTDRSEPDEDDRAASDEDDRAAASDDGDRAIPPSGGARRRGEPA